MFANVAVSEIPDVVVKPVISDSKRSEEIA